MDELVVGLVGKAGAGKDYVFSALRQHPLMDGVDMERISLADEVRLEIEEVLSIERWSSPLWAKPYPPEIRKLLQWWGTDLRRAEDPEYWTKRTSQHIIRRFENGLNVAVVTDVRFPNEADMIRMFGGIVVKVYAPDQLRAERLGVADVRDLAHESESAQDMIDAHWVLYNDGVELFTYQLDLLANLMLRWQDA